MPIAVTTKRRVVLPKAVCERKQIWAGTLLRISGVGDGFCVTPVLECINDDKQPTLQF